MKKTLKVLSLLTVAAMTLTLASMTLTANADFITLDDAGTLPETISYQNDTYTRLDDETGYFQNYIVNSGNYLAYDCYTSADGYTENLSSLGFDMDVSVGSGGVVLFSNPAYQQTSFTVTDADAFDALYEAYADTLDFDKESSSGDTVTLYNATDKSDELEAIAAFAQDAYAQGIIRDVSYQSVCASTTDIANYTDVFLVNFPTEYLADFEDFCADYGAQVLGVNTYDYSIASSCLVELTGGADVQIAFDRDLHEALPDEIALLETNEGDNIIQGQFQVMCASDTIELMGDEVDLLSIELADPILVGDMDGSGTVDANDAHDVLVANATFNLTGDYNIDEDAFATADVNGDGVLDALDAHEILVLGASYNLTGQYE